MWLIVVQLELGWEFDESNLVIHIWYLKIERNWVIMTKIECLHVKTDRWQLFWVIILQKNACSNVGEFMIKVIHIRNLEEIMWYISDLS